MILYGANPDIVQWVSQRLTGIPNYFDAGSVALGIVVENNLICGVVYSGFRLKPDGSPLLIEMSIASIDKRWCTRHNLKAIFAVPFIQYGLERVQLTTSVNNVEVNSMAERWGFQKEGIHRKADIFGGDAISYGMLREDCRWLK